jgi:hypothetical protein
MWDGRGEGKGGRKRKEGEQPWPPAGKPEGGGALGASQAAGRREGGRREVRLLIPCWNEWSQLIRLTLEG